MADLENHSINEVLARKGAETQRFYPQLWISPPLWIPKNQRVFSVIICVKNSFINQGIQLHRSDSTLTPGLILGK